MPLAITLVIAANLVINEILYDPVGADGGREFVELWNAGPETASLEGVQLQFANGANEPHWETRWTGVAGQCVAPLSVWLVVDQGWDGVTPDAEARLGLQNGPDALRLTRASETLDTVGWGDLAWPEMYEGRPAVDTAGLSLARRPDGVDDHDNAADFVEAEPTPGQPNWRRFAPELQAVTWEPPSLDRPHQTMRASLSLVNRGLDVLRDAAITVSVGPWSVVVGMAALPPDGAAGVAAELVPGERGSWPVQVRITGTDAGDTVTHAAGFVQIGVPSLHLSEVMADPVAGGEWCEVCNDGLAPRSLDSLRLRDEDGSWRELPAVDLSPGGCLVLAADSVELLDWLGQLAADGVAPACTAADPVTLTGWPSLNNSAPPGRLFADRLYLGAADGSVLDHVTLGSGTGDVIAGRSLERDADNEWRPATAPAGGTPGCPPRTGLAVADGELGVTPNPFHPDAGTGAAIITFEVPRTAIGWEAQIYDLWGFEIRDLGGDDLGPGPRESRWDGHDGSGGRVAPGGYVLSLSWRLSGGATISAHRCLLVVGNDS